MKYDINAKVYNGNPAWLITLTRMLLFRENYESRMIFFVVCAMASMKSIYTHLTVYMFGLLSTITWHKEYFIRQAWRQIWSDCQETYKNVIAYEKVCNANPAWLIKLVYQPVLIRINIKMRSIIIIIYFTSFSSREHIRCKPTSSCKSCKFQSEPPDQHPRGGTEGVEGGFVKVWLLNPRAGN